MTMRLVSLCLALLLTACAAARFDVVGADDPQSPFYAEFCAVSQIKKRPGFGADIRGDIGGHSLFYLEGACLDPASRYPVLQLCESGGSGLSVNEHFANAKWVATPGHDFFFDGGLPPGVPVTQASYRAVQREAQRLGIYAGVGFHEVVFRAMPKGWSREDWKYEMSVGTDYAVALGRGRYCARVPVDRPAMRRMIDFLNAENAPYRAGADFNWDLFSDNCIHLAHNALAVAGLWAPWPTHRPFLISVFDFPVPRNEFVNLMRRTNDEIPPDPAAAYDDPEWRRALLAGRTPPASPGSLALSRPLRPGNALYQDDLKLIFYDDPMFGPYQGRFDRIFGEPRYTDAAANRAHFAAVARTAIVGRRPLADWLTRARYADHAAEFAVVYARYYALMTQWADGRQSLAAMIDPG